MAQAATRHRKRYLKTHFGTRKQCEKVKKRQSEKVTKIQPPTFSPFHYSPFSLSKFLGRTTVRSTPSPDPSESTTNEGERFTGFEHKKPILILKLVYYQRQFNGAI